MNFNIETHYQHILKSLEEGSRALVRFNRDELEFLLHKLQSYSDLNELEKILCLIDHSAMDFGAFESLLINFLKSELPDRHLIFVLNCSRKHIIQARFKKGHRLGFEFLEALKPLLHHSSPEVVEWTLRTIEECGTQGVYFLQELAKIKPPPWKWFNAHQRSVREIIEMLERRWRRFEKS
jgi:hypothetical protein